MSFVDAGCCWTSCDIDENVDSWRGGCGVDCLGEDVTDEVVSECSSTVDSCG